MKPYFVCPAMTMKPYRASLRLSCRINSARFHGKGGILPTKALLREEAIECCRQTEIMRPYAVKGRTNAVPYRDVVMPREGRSPKRPSAGAAFVRPFIILAVDD